MQDGASPELALELAAPDLLDLVLADVADLLPALAWPPPIAGADLLDDIWGVVSSSAGKLASLFDWLWDRFLDVWRWVREEANTLFLALYNTIKWVAGEVWNAVAPIGGAILSAAGYVAAQVWAGVGQVGSALLGLAGWIGGQLAGVVNAIVNFITGVASTLWGLISSIAGQVWDFLRPGVEVVTNTVNDLVREVPTVVIQGAAAIGEGFLEGLRWLVEHAFDSFLPSFEYHQGTLRRMLAADYSSAEELFEDRASHSVSGAIVGLFEDLVGTIAEIVPLFAGIGTAYAQGNVQLALKKVHPTIPDLAELRDAFLRDLVDEGRHDDYLGRLGFSPELIGTFKQLYFLEPNPSDLIRFLVREVYSPDVVALFGQDQDFPPQAVPAGRRIGLSEEVLRNYWAAHWDLPSPSQGFEMFHRGLIDQDTLEVLLRALDVMPFWRDKLIGIAYNVPGRIDLRRMFAAGVVDEDRVRRGYLELGYTPEDADALTRFAVAAAAGSDKALPSGAVLRAYSKGLMDRAAAAAALADLGYGSDDVELMLSLEDLKVAEEDADLEEAVVAADFRAGAISEADARSELASLGVPSDRVDLLVRRWRNRRAVKDVTLSAAQVLRALREDVLDEGAARGRLSALGYNEDDVRVLVELATPEPAPKEAPELSVAQLQKANRVGLLTDDELRQRLSRKGFTAADIELLEQLAEPPAGTAEAPELTKADLRALFRAQLIDEAELRDRLGAKGYAAGDVDLLVGLYSARAA